RMARSFSTVGRGTKSPSEWLLLLLHQERGATILRPAALVVLRARGPLLAIAHERDAAGLDALADEIVHRRFCATIAETEVVLVRPALIAVSFDEHQLLGVRFQPLGVRVEDPPEVVLDSGWESLSDRESRPGRR